MKRAKQPKQPNKLLVSVDRVRRLTADDLRAVAGGGGAAPEPCSHSNQIQTTN